MTPLRRLASLVARTPLHPQWLLGPRRPPPGLGERPGLHLDVGAADRWIRPHLHADAGYVALDYPATGGALYAASPDVFADAARLPFVDASFDGVLCLEVIEHVPEPAQVLAEIARVLKPGGTAWVSMPFLYPVHDAPYDFQRFTAHGLRRDAEAAGLQVVALRKQGHALHVAGLLANLALAGAAARLPSPAPWLLALPLLPLVLAINVGAWAMALLWPDWDALAIGHELEARKP